MKKLSLTTQIAIALATAIIAGIALQGHPEFANNYIKPFGVIFLNLLKFIVGPLVLFSIMAGILSMNDISKVGKLGIRAVLYFTLTTVFAVTLGLVVSTAVKDILPLIKIDADNAAAEAGVNNMTFMEQIVNMFPSNLIEPISSMTMIQIIVIALFFGVAMVHVGEKGEMAKKVTLSFNEVVGKILSYIIAVAPYGVFCMLTPVVVTNGPGVLGSYAALVVLGKQDTP